MDYKNLYLAYKSSMKELNITALYHEIFNETPSRFYISLKESIIDELMKELTKDLQYDIFSDTKYCVSVGVITSSTIYISETEKIIFQKNQSDEGYYDCNDDEESDEKNITLEIIHNSKSDKVNKFINTVYSLKKVVVPENDIGFVLESDGDLYIHRKKLKFSYKDTNFNTHYNDGFNEFDSYLRDCLKKDTKNGIIVLFGIPGSGKSCYIKNLLATCKTKFVFFPVGLLKAVESNPSIMSFFIKNGAEDTCYIVEDAENVVQSDDSGRPSGLSTLLNFSDSIISDVFRCKFLLTFNKEDVWKNIDKALVRKGRLLCEYKFENLTLEKTKILFKELHNKDYDGSKGLNLADIYNYYDDFGLNQEKNKKVGFL